VRRENFLSQENSYLAGFVKKEQCLNSVVSFLALVHHRDTEHTEDAQREAVTSTGVRLTPSKGVR
jgi:hypothetical protein